MKKIFCLILILSQLIIVSCDNNKLSDNKIKIIINDFLQNECVTINPNLNNNKWFPVTVKLDTGSLSYENTKYKIGKYDILVSAGLLQVKDGFIEDNSIFSSFGNNNSKIPVKIYSLTDKGNKYYHEKKLPKFIGGSIKGFCVAKLKVDKILSYSKPSEYNGYTIINVNYTSSPDKVSDWFDLSQFKKFYPSIEKKLSPERKDQAVLVLMNNGWVHESQVDL